MMNIFQLASNDQSVYYLGQIFGNVGFALTGTGPALLAQMFKVLNTSLLALAAIVVTYTTVVGVIKTAQEGEFLGKHWSSVWVPIRTLLGIVALFPTKSGYCAIQVVFMWFLVQGVGVADMVWTTTLNYLDRSGAVQTANPPSDVVGTVPTIMKQMFGNAVCQAALTKLNSNDADAIGRSTITRSGQGGAISFGRQGDAGSAEVCGKVEWGKFPASTTLDPSQQRAIADAQAQALQTIVPVMEGLANHYVKMVIDDASCWRKGGEAGSLCAQSPDKCRFFDKYDVFLPRGESLSSCIVWRAGDAWNELQSYGGSNFMTESVKLFTGYANNALITDRMRIAGRIPGGNIKDESFKKSQVNGWITAGALYYYIASKNNQSQGDFQNFLNGIAVNVDPKNSLMEGCEGNYCDLRFRFNRYKSYPELDPYLYPWAAQAAMYCGLPTPFPIICQMGANTGPLAIARKATDEMNAAVATGGGFQAAGSITIGGGGSSSNPVVAFIQSVSSKIFTGFARSLSPSVDAQGMDSTNPLVTLQGFGHNLLNMADAVFLIVVGLMVVLGGMSTQVTVFGTTVNYVAGVSWALAVALLPIAGTLLAYMISVGSLLGVYLPLVPYTLFAFGVIGWFLAVIEAMVAAPLVGLGILAPGGGEILGKAEGAIMMLLNIFLRPTLMVFGLMAGMLLSYVVVRFINAAFFTVIGQMTASGMGMFEGFLLLMAYAGLLITALNKCFALIYMIPDRVMVWIGGHPQGYGEAEAAEQVKGKIAMGAELGGGAGKAAGGSAAASMKEMKAGGDKARERKEAHKEEMELKGGKDAQTIKMDAGERKGTPSTPPSTPPGSAGGTSGGGPGAGTPGAGGTAATAGGATPPASAAGAGGAGGPAGDAKTESKPLSPEK